ncbi:hypothetical protein Nepgr_015625 [Nepenthes gracilis]|uniref:Uncharacterized protein n=1 Tax=Nepenthes gracilis TaxID=150966 RepID=A0AAD3XR98_NEPGR|nr:hypothetical protein Nepgr_015625 [Nepenthes gracilis]
MWNSIARPASSFRFDDNKTLGSNKLSSAFLIRLWDVIYHLIMEAISDVVGDGKHLKRISSTLICLVPKVVFLSKITNFCTISCCNVLCNAISKVIVSELKAIIPSIVDKC